MQYFYERRKNDFVSNPIRSLTPLPHIHPHLEMIYLESGSSVAALDGKEFLIGEGDLFLAFPNQIHAFHDRSELKGWIFIFAPELFPDLERLFNQKTPMNPVIDSGFLPKDLAERLQSASGRIGSSDAFEIIAGKGQLLSVLGEVLPAMQLVDSPAAQDSIKNVLIYCAENFTEPLTLDSLSEALHLNRFYISHIFCKRMGMSFPDFINGLRLERACHLLSKGWNITEAAYASGFSSIRTFNRIFARDLKMTPSQYIRQEITR